MSTEDFQKMVKQQARAKRIARKKKKQAEAQAAAAATATAPVPVKRTVVTATVSTQTAEGLAKIEPVWRAVWDQVMEKPYYFNTQTKRGQYTVPTKAFLEPPYLICDSVTLPVTASSDTL
jgi:hypothetical protein